MRFHAPATDYDGTLAHNGIAGADAIEALRQLRKSGRRSIMVTGRLLADLRTVFPELELLDVIVAENGAILLRYVEPRSARTSVAATARIYRSLAGKER
jgi:hypothetical protein